MFGQVKAVRENVFKCANITFKGHLISEQICEDIDFPKLQGKHTCAES